MANELWMLALGLLCAPFRAGVEFAYRHDRYRPRLRKPWPRDGAGAIGICRVRGFFPVMAITLMALFGWQQSWLVFGLFLALVALPLLVFLSRFEPLPKEAADDEPTGRLTVRMCCATGVSIWCCRFMLRRHFC